MNAERSPNVTWHEGPASRTERWTAGRLGGATVWLTGFSGSGKSTVAGEVARLLVRVGRAAFVLDGDNVRHGLNGDLGFSAEDRTENVRRNAQVAALLADAGLVTLVPVISPYREGRDAARAVHVQRDLPFYEVFVDAPIELCERRDPKGLYAKARAGQLTGMTGIDDPYEPPLSPELVLPVADLTVWEAAARVVEALGEDPGTAPSS